MRELPIKAAEMDVYLSPEIPDTSGRLFVNTAKRMIDGQGSNFDEIRGFISCQNFHTSITSRYEERYGPLSEQQESDIAVIAEVFNKEQLWAMAQCVATTRSIQLVQGPPGTGKTWWTARIIAVYRSVGLRVLATAPSNVAADAILHHLMLNDREHNWHVEAVRFAGDDYEVNVMVELWESFHHKPDRKANYLRSLTADEAKKYHDVEATSEAVKSPRHRPTMDLASLHCRVLTEARYFVGDGFMLEKPEPIENEEYVEFRDMWYDPQLMVNRKATQKGQDGNDAGEDIPGVPHDDRHDDGSGPKFDHAE